MLLYCVAIVNNHQIASLFHVVQTIMGSTFSTVMCKADTSVYKPPRRVFPFLESNTNGYKDPLYRFEVLGMVP